MSENVIYTLFVVGILSVLGFLGDRMFQKTGIPDVVLLLFLGTFIGPYLGLVDISRLAAITPYFGTLVLIFILFDGGLELDFDVILRLFLPVLVLVLLSIGTVLIGVASIAIYYYEWHWLPAFLLATFLSNISGAIVLPVVNHLAIEEDDKTILKLEAAASDVLVILLFVTFMSLLQAMGTNAGEVAFNPRETLSTLAGSFSVSIVVGSLTGTVWMIVLNRIYLMSHNYMATLGMLLILYSICEFLGASGMMAILFFGIVLANSAKFGHFFNIKEIHYTATEMKHLHTTFSFLLRTFFLVYIGFFLSKEMLEIEFLKMGATVIGILVLVRCVTGALFSLMFRKDGRTCLVVISMLPRGLAVAALASVPAQEVSKLIAERESKIEVHRTELVEIDKRLESNAAAKISAIEENDTGALANLTKVEIKLAADGYIKKTKISTNESVLNNLLEIKKPTDTFILFAPLSILVTNILMSLGCMLIKPPKQRSRLSPLSASRNRPSESPMVPTESRVMLRRRPSEGGPGDSGAKE